MLTSLVLALCIGAAAEEPPPKAPETRSLFDGATLDGWKKADYYKAETQNVHTADGTIVLPVGDSLSGVTTTRKDLPTADYELSYEAMRTEGGDFFAAATFPVRDGFVTLVNGGWGGNITGLSCIDGADASENETTTGFTYKNNTWYRFRIRVTVDAVRSWIDDKEIIAVDVRDRELTTRIQVRASEPMGFSAWESAGLVRKITIRPLTKPEIVANHVGEP